MSHQKTILCPVRCAGIGLHTGKEAELTLLPAPPGSGIVFERADLPGAPLIPARPEHVVDVHYATTLAAGDVQVRTVEHLLAALSGLGVDNLRVRLTGPEVPILDGSAAPFVSLLKTAGIRRYLLPKTPIWVRRPITVRAGDRWISAEPAGRLVVDYAMTFGHAKFPAQRIVLTLNRETFIREVAPSRTFGFLRDVQALWSQGLALGGSLENAVVIGEEGVLNETLRFEDEMIRHKVLDLIGDLYLLGRPLKAKVTAHGAGHALHAHLAREILRQHRAAEAAATAPEPAWELPFLTPEPVSPAAL